MTQILDNLTIVIPSFNRHLKINTLLNKICNLRNDYSFKVLILDNGSTPPIEQFLKENLFSGLGFTTILRNQANIGGGANVLLAHIQAETEWTWLLGDDDLPVDNCFEIVNRDISIAKQNDFLFKYNSAAGSWPELEQTLSNELDFVTFCDNFRYYSNILFISNSLFRTQAMRCFAQPMMNITHTMCPWILGYLMNLENGKVIQIKTEYLIINGVAENNDSWDYHKLLEGILSFADIEGHFIFKKKMLPNLILNYSGKNRLFILQMIKFSFQYVGYSAEYWKWFYRKSALCFTGYRKFSLLFLAAIVPIYLRSKFLHNILIHKIEIKSIAENGRN